MDFKLGFVGGGVMAEVLISGILEQGLLPPSHIEVSNRRPQRAAQLVERYGVVAHCDNRRVSENADLLVLSVKPQTLGTVLPELAPAPETLVLSIIAGAPARMLRAGLGGHPHVARCMPNLPCRIRQGMTVWYAPESASEDDCGRVQAMLEVMGRAIRVTTESHIDRATAVNGTGPAIVAEFVKAMTEAATYIGEPRSLARETVLATLLGTAELIRQQGEDGVHVAQLIDEVTSPGGTTSRSLFVLKQGRFGAVVTEAVDAAYQRTLALGSAQEDQGS